MSIKFSINPSRISQYRQSEPDIVSDGKPQLRKMPVSHRRAVIVRGNSGVVEGPDGIVSINPECLPLQLPYIEKNNEVSVKGAKRLRNSLSWLSYLSRPRNAVWQNEVKDNNFQLAFITLTLPSKQMHSHGEITSRCLNLFLTHLRKKFRVSNYIWRAEIQANGNIHYHLVIDRWIHYMMLRKYWNLALAKLGYIEAYAATYKEMDYETYRYWRHQRGNYDEKKIRKAFKEGVRTQWLSPNTTDVHRTRDIKSLSAYISKYLTKRNERIKTGIYQDSLTELTGRLWYCSTSLSNLKNLTLNFSNHSRALFANLKKNMNSLYKEFDYCRIVYFNIRDLPSRLYAYLFKTLWGYAIETGYLVPCSN